jgi:hypothetical protein
MDNGLVERWVMALKDRFRELNGNLIARLTDNAGAKRAALLNSDGNEVLSIDSAGNIRRGAVLVGSVSTAGLVNLQLPNLIGGKYLRGWPFTRVLTFTNSWVQASLHGIRPYASYYQDPTGKVFLSGAISGGTVGLAAFTLPDGFRPYASELFCVASSGGIARVDVEADGRVVPVTGSGTFYLDGISFYPAAYAGLFNAAAFTAGWTDFAGSFSATAYYKDQYGRVHLRGLMRSGTVPGTAFTLPAGFRASRRTVFATMSNSLFGRVDAYENGQVIVDNGSNAWVSVSGMMFPASDVAPETNWALLQEMSAWVDFDPANWGTASFWVDGTGRVHLSGLTKDGALLSVAHAIPPGLRPARALSFPVASNNAYGQVDISNTGNATFPSGSPAWLSYGGCHWLPL